MKIIVKFNCQKVITVQPIIFKGKITPIKIFKKNKMKQRIQKISKQIPAMGKNNNQIFQDRTNKKNKMKFCKIQMIQMIILLKTKAKIMIKLLKEIKNQIKKQILNIKS